jgi:catecholate siderophore receptor
VRRFEIPAGVLEDVAAAYQDATGIHVSFAREDMRNLQSPGVTGLFSPEAALERIVAGTKLTFRWIEPNNVLVELSRVSASVDVREHPGPTLPQLTAPLREIPQTITVISERVMEQQAATNLRDVLRNVPGLTIAAGEGGVPAGDNLTLRGFSARNDLFVDGVRDLSPQSRDPFNLQQVEVVKGPTSAYTGRGSTGGVINLVSKTPGLQPGYGFSLLGGTDGTKRVTTDLNAPVGFLGERTAFRLNTLYHDARVAGRDEVYNSRWGVAPSLSLGLGTPTRYTFSYYKLRQDNLPDYGIPWVPATNNVLIDYRDQPAPVPRDTFYGLKLRDGEETGADMATFRFDHSFTDNANLMNQFRYQRATRDSITTAPRFASVDSTVINRNGPSWVTKDDVFDNQTNFSTRFQTGRIKHTLNTGLALTHEGNDRIARTVQDSPTTTLFNPDPNQPFNGSITVNPVVGDLTANSQSLYAFDTVEFNDKLQLNGGLRLDRFDVSGINTSNVRLDRVDRMANLRAGAVYKLSNHGNVYASFGTSMNPSLEGLSYQPADTTLEPEKSFTYEAGTKWDLAGQRLSLTAAVFRVEKTNARTPGATPDDPPIVLDGKQRVNGIELGAGGFVTRHWHVFGGYTLLDSRIVESNNAAEEGSRMINTPKHSASVWSTYTLRRLQLGGGVRFASMRYGNLTNTRSVDGYTTVDAMASYQVSRFMDLRLNLYNLNNAFYFDRLGGGHLIPGPARSALLGTTFHF